MINKVGGIGYLEQTIKSSQHSKKNAAKKAVVLNKDTKEPTTLRSQYNRIYSKMGLNAEQIKILWQHTKDTLLKQSKSVDFDKRSSLTSEEIHTLTDPEKVADRILSFAKNLAGGDAEKIDMLERAVEKGFEEAERILGELPDISKETFALVKEGFAKWREEIS